MPTERTQLQKDARLMLALGVLLSLLAIASLAIADEPKATFQTLGKPQVDALMVLDAVGSTGDSFRWEVIPDAKVHEFGNQGQKMVFFMPPHPGKFTVLLIAAGTVGEGKIVTTDVSRIEIVVPDDKPPTPEPDNPAPGPDPDDHAPAPDRDLPAWADELRSDVAAWTAELPPDARDRATLLAYVFFVKAACTGCTIDDAQQLMTETGNDKRGVTAGYGTDWETWTNRFVARLKQLHADGRLELLEDFRTAWTAIAGGLMKGRQ
ncbi:hypothetical protein Pan216_30130 [Planctomycetes bacterium Pan216]|uniref:Uncharacterized protein n=1 Tax=Kolteria novifilia TaxID=2527975 RepID=A0A518B5B6_9BACT|nr:hypothetical protein Pan216_30130 [Planctomycetes bacterium Pan216]